MNAPMSDRNEQGNTERIEDEAPAEVNSQRSGLSEADSRGSLADAISPDGVRMSDDVPGEQMNVSHQGDAS